MTKNEPLDKRLYNQVKKEAKKKFTAWPSAYASGWLVQEYKRRGGRYKSKSPPKDGLTRWFKEEWIDVCQLPKKVPCGRPTRKSPMKDWMKEYPYCRPSTRVNSRSPKPYTEYTKAELKRRCKLKRKSPMRRLRSRSPRK